MAETRRETRDDRGRDWQRWAAAAGVAFVLLALIGFFLAPDPPGADASNAEVLTYFNDKEGELRTQAALFALGGAVLLWFAGTLAALLRRAMWRGGRSGGTADLGRWPDNTRLPAIILASAGTAVGLYLAGTAAYTALATRAGQEIDGSAGRALFELGGALITFTSYPAAVYVLAASFGVARTRLLPDWVAWLGYAVAAILIVDGIGATIGDSDTFGPSGAIGVTTFLSFLLWNLAASALLAWRREPAGELPVRTGDAR